ncbi:MAG: type III-B CRISPR module RAMP protein Cmr1 [Opitutaceae bacterium]|nr:type III-B CRISPR module RAMP protein Cmr1 [Opitutaceae bacterium]
MSTYSLTFLTPLFSKGSYDDKPEIRPPSIRGQIHWWFRALGGKYDDEKAIFGGVHNGTMASKIVVRVSNVCGQSNIANTLPHKNGGLASPKAAYMPDCSFTLHILERLGGLADHQQAFERALHAWLLAGSLGLRSTRGGGAFQWDKAPTRPDQFRSTLDGLLQGAPLRAALLDEAFPTAEAARTCATDTISHQAMARIRFPLGAVRQGAADPAPPRKTSPLRLTIRHFDDGYRLIAVWDNRTAVTGNTLRDLAEASDLLANGTRVSTPKKIGTLLSNSPLVR